MPIHDWTRVPAGIYHNAHRGWTVELKRALNRGLLPKTAHAMLERRAGGRDHALDALPFRDAGPRGVLNVSEMPPRVARAARVDSEPARYAMKADRIAIRHELGQVMAVIEVISPGDKDSRTRSVPSSARPSTSSATASTS